MTDRIHLSIHDFKNKKVNNSKKSFLSTWTSDFSWTTRTYARRDNLKKEKETWRCLCSRISTSGKRWYDLLHARQKLEKRVFENKISTMQKRLIPLGKRQVHPPVFSFFTSRPRLLETVRGAGSNFQFFAPLEEGNRSLLHFLAAVKTGLFAINILQGEEGERYFNWKSMGNGVRLMAAAAEGFKASDSGEENWWRSLELVDFARASSKRACQLRVGRKIGRFLGKRKSEKRRISQIKLARFFPLPPTFLISPFVGKTCLQRGAFVRTTLSFLLILFSHGNLSPWESWATKGEVGLFE